MALPPNPRIEGAIRSADTDTMAVAYALLQVAAALREATALGPSLDRVAHEIDVGTRRIANAIRNLPDEP
jgi:hypothetical protein